MLCTGFIKMGIKMDKKRIDCIKEQLKKELTKQRYEHTLGVAYTAAALAMCHGENMEKAWLAGLLHDCAKGIATDKLESMILQAGIVLSEEDRACKQIYHAIYAPVLAKEIYGVEDEEILSALRWHTTGCKDMSCLDKLVFIADAIEPGRGVEDYLQQARRFAFSDPDQAMSKLLSSIVNHLRKKNVHVHEKTVECMEWIKQITERKTDGE